MNKKRKCAEPLDAEDEAIRTVVLNIGLKPEIDTYYPNESVPEIAELLLQFMTHLYRKQTHDPELHLARCTDNGTGPRRYGQFKFIIGNGTYGLVWSDIRMELEVVTKEQMVHIWRSYRITFTPSINKNTWEDFCQAAYEHCFPELADELQEKNHASVTMHMWNAGYNSWDRKINVPVVSLSKLAVPSKLKESLHEDINLFTQGKDIYAKNSMPYKRVYFFKGDSGTNKTALVLALAAKHNRPVYMVHGGSGLTDTSLIHAISAMHRNGILVFEDIDVLFNPRALADPQVMALSFSLLCNLLNGCFVHPGFMVVMTSNCAHPIPPELLAQSRVDRFVELQTMKQKHIKQMLKDLAGIENAQELDYIVKEIRNVQVTPSHIREACMFWKARSITKREVETKSKAIVGCIRNMSSKRPKIQGQYQ